jgi:hypothetical protein
MIYRFCVLVTIGWSIAVSADAAEPPKQGGVRLIARNQATVLKYLEPVSYSSGKVVRLYYVVQCHATDVEMPFPAVRVGPPSENSTGLAAVREIFRDDKNVTVTEEPMGVIRVSIGKVPTAILQTRLSSVNLDKDQQYDPRLAIGAIESTKEMEAAERSLGLAGVSLLAGTAQLPLSGIPHLPKSLKNLTVDQALDVIAKTWQGPVVYGVCANQSNRYGTKTYWIGYAGGVFPIAKEKR